MSASSGSLRFGARARDARHGARVPKPDTSLSLPSLRPPSTLGRLDASNLHGTVPAEEEQHADPIMPLTGIRVVDLTRVLSGPYCSMFLADMGADVIKVETPDGDSVRRQGAMRNGFSWYFASFNRNKRSIAIDLRADAGREVLAKLIAGADVLVDNFRPGVLDKMGFSKQRLDALKPDLVCCSITGFGDDGPYRDRPAFDFIAQAMSGFMSVTGSPDGSPLRAAPPISDLIAGLQGALGICAALVGRGRTGRGERVGASLTNGLVSTLAYLP